jgi:NAD(P)H-dependent FMN reductase
MRLAIISGSQRPGSQSAKVARFVQGLLDGGSPAVETFFYDLGEHPLPPCEDEHPVLDESENPEWTPISRELRGCDGAVIVTPEWGAWRPRR